METPHVHHWDSMMVFEETTGSFFPADLFAQPGDQSPVVRENLGKEACMMAREVGIFAAEWPVLKAAERIEELAPAWIHPMHGGSLPRVAAHYYFDALRNEPFAFDGGSSEGRCPASPHRRRKWKPATEVRSRTSRKDRESYRAKCNPPNSKEE